MMRSAWLLVGLFLLLSTGSRANSPDECHLRAVIHKLEYPGCTPMQIPSFACTGRCTSYVQVSGSKLWLQERSCMCCQESGEREAIVQLFCPKAKNGEPKVRRLVTKAPSDCMCRPCTALEDDVVPSEVAAFADPAAAIKTFIKQV